MKTQAEINTKIRELEGMLKDKEGFHGIRELAYKTKIDNLKWVLEE